MGSNTVGVYAADVGGTAQLFGINENNEAFQITAGGALTLRAMALGSFMILMGEFAFETGLTLSGSETITLVGTAKLVLI